MEGKPWLGPNEEQLGVIAPLTSSTGYRLGLLIYPDLSKLQFDLYLNPRVISEDFPAWTSDGANREAMLEEGYPITQWIRELTKADENIVLLSNSVQSNFQNPYDCFIEDGVLHRQGYAAGDGKYSFGGPIDIFVLDSDTRERRLRNCKVTDERTDRFPWRRAVSGRPFVIDRELRKIPHWDRDKGDDLKYGEVPWLPNSTEAAFSAVCESVDGQVVLAYAIQPLTAYDFGRVLIDHGISDAILLGGSGDVGVWIEGRGLEAAAAREGSARGSQAPGTRNLNGVITLKKLH
ncbi:hypothetical protein FOL47_005385 [Perkinsus chesapeaki]|uniref:Phosphodiester glycosidase domain-containing protein n=1 Tax=Perkinsus chesapeaki TaxID=330153 RepID=A0A7J6N2Y6_PERCH|nr:hypothetical protein FOL47_005385 [Perkinsus chesapeaki]